MKMNIRYSEKLESTNLLGPGNRAVLWVYGCCFDCPGCIAHNYRYGPYEDVNIKELVNWFRNTKAEGITISGGEPMLQAEALSKMIQEIRKHQDIGVIVYTGFIYEELLKRAEHNINLKSFLNDIDLLIDGPFVQELNDDVPYRGSSNQRLIAITDRYQDEVNDYYFSSGGRKIDIQISEKRTLMIGVPSKDQARIWKNIKALGK